MISGGFGGELAEHYEAHGGVALAWLLAQGDDISPIPGTNKVRYLDVTLTKTEVEEITKIAWGRMM